MNVFRLQENVLDFQLNEEQLHLKKSVREFAEREIAPNVRKWDDASEFPLSTIKELGKLGLLGVVFPHELGGAGMESLWRRTLRCVPTTFFWPRMKHRKSNTFRNSLLENLLARGV
jgi:hypothetical protein